MGRFWSFIFQQSNPHNTVLNLYCSLGCRLWSQRIWSFDIIHPKFFVQARNFRNIVCYQGIRFQEQSRKVVSIFGRKTKTRPPFRYFSAISRFQGKKQFHHRVQILATLTFSVINLLCFETIRIILPQIIFPRALMRNLIRPQSVLARERSPVAQHGNNLLLFFQSVISVWCSEVWCSVKWLYF